MRSLLFFLILGLGVFASCKSDTQQAQELPPAPNNQVEAPEILATLFTPNAKVFRGVDFGMDLASVIAQETAEAMEQTDKTANYSIDFNEQEFADFRYVAGDSTLSKMEVEIYAATPESAANYHQLLKEYFTAKNLPRTENLWDGSENGIGFTVFMKLLEDPQAPGVTIVWEKTAM